MGEKGNYPHVPKLKFFFFFLCKRQQLFFKIQINFFIFLSKKVYVYVIKLLYLNLY
jgi:hypothetical protein